MASPRYDPRTQRRRPIRRGIKRMSLCYVLAGTFLLAYVVFLARWGFGTLSSLEDFVSTEPLSSNLRPTRNAVYSQSENETLDSVIAAVQPDEPQGVEKHVHQVDVIDIGLSRPAPLTAAFAATDARSTAVTEIPDVQEHKVVVEEMSESMQTMEEMADAHEAVQAPEVVAAEVVATERVAATTTPKHDRLTFTLAPSAPKYATVHGYKPTKKFLKSYRHDPNESLFLFFTCSDKHFQANDWSDACVQGKQHVYDVFAKSPGRNRLVTVYAGSEKYWKHHNEFNDDPDLRVKGVPCIMRWDGRNGSTGGMLVHESLYDEPFLRYLFKNTDQPEILFAPQDVKNKQIVTVKGYRGYLDAMSKYVHEQDPVPTFLMMVSGRLRHNNRPWCPYCRYSELPLEFAFYSYAPKNARMIRVEVTDSYAEWKKHNKFGRDKNVQLRIVPLLFHVKPVPASSANGTKSFKATSHRVRYDRLASLRELFSSFA
ncbi:unnamed protein product [Hyaloperonospora brassicae]|uniref:Thioredoxin domain-containing protein n=1 Tax=Hyaloperonospora brassicae TaxID=162125 RepID=A0AAV0V5M9_HYABA|nr:unnamed protein product [Hyaloperonospora brassicae]